MQKFITEYWERVLFAVVGFGCLAFSFLNLFAGKVTEASAVFAMGIFSFIYSNLSRFKRFKGLGFEAELWEDKQKEAADLIERLKTVVSIYTREIILGAVRRMRFHEVKWRNYWNLYEELIAQHNVLGQKIDFTDLKKRIDDYFLFDMCGTLANSIRKSIEAAKAKAGQSIAAEFGSPIKDAEGFGKRTSELGSVQSSINDDPFKIGERSNLAGKIILMAETARQKLKQKFNVNVDFQEGVLERLQAISALYERRPVQVTDELVSWAEDRTYDF